MDPSPTKDPTEIDLNLKAVHAFFQKLPVEKQSRSKSDTKFTPHLGPIFDFTHYNYRPVK